MNEGPVIDMDLIPRNTQRTTSHTHTYTHAHTTYSRHRKIEETVSRNKFIAKFFKASKIKQN